MKPITVVVKQNVNRNRKEIFSFVSVLSNHQKIYSANLESRQTSEGPIGVGTTMTNVAKFMGMKMEEKFIITDFVQDQILAKESVPGSTFYTTDKTEFTDGPNGTTDVTITVYAELTGILKWFPSAVNNKIEKILIKDWKNCKEKFENRSW